MRDVNNAESPEPAVEPQHLLAPGAVAKLLGVTPRTISNWCDCGLLNCITMPSKHRRIPASEVERLRAMLR